jgi:hypothetical protein
MGIFGKLLETMERYRQARAEREALRLLITRKDTRLLRDANCVMTPTSRRGGIQLERLIVSYRARSNSPVRSP